MQETQEYRQHQIRMEGDEEYEGEWYSDCGRLNLTIKELPLNVETLDWEGMDINVISSMMELIFDIQNYQFHMAWVRDETYNELPEIERTYLENTSKIGICVLDILECLREKYNIPYTEMKLFNKPLRNLFLNYNSKWDK